MKASETHLAKLLDGTRQFVIPIYQRPYSWIEAQCKQLFDDMLLGPRRTRGCCLAYFELS